MPESTVDEIRARFDEDVERFSNLDTGQTATMDAPLIMALVAEATAATTPHAREVLDIGCGAGNYTLKLLEALGREGGRDPGEARSGSPPPASPPSVNVTLSDLSRPMLDRAVRRIDEATRGNITPIQGDVREVHLGERRFDVIVAAQCLHHLRGEEQWRDVFARVFKALRAGGSFWIADTVVSESPAVEAIIRRRHGDYLVAQRDEAYRDHVFAYIAKEDTPRPIPFQLDLLRAVGFEQVDVLHKHNRFMALGGVRAGENQPPDDFDAHD